MWSRLVEGFSVTRLKFEILYFTSLFFFFFFFLEGAGKNRKIEKKKKRKTVTGPPHSNVSENCLVVTTYMLPLPLRLESIGPGRADWEQQQLLGLCIGFYITHTLNSSPISRPNCPQIVMLYAFSESQGFNIVGNSQKIHKWCQQSNFSPQSNPHSSVLRLRRQLNESSSFTPFTTLFLLLSPSSHIWYTFFSFLLLPCNSQKKENVSLIFFIFVLPFQPPKPSDRAQVQSREVRLPDSPPISLDDQDVQIVSFVTVLIFLTDMSLSYYNAIF